MSVLGSYWAKSPAKRGAPGEALTAHLEAAYLGCLGLRDRIGRIRCLPDDVREEFWRLAALAAISHDAGKLADGFADMVTGRARTWPQRHEVVSLGFLPYLLPDQLSVDWVAAGVATHHRAINGSGEGKASLQALYGGLRDGAEFAAEIGPVNPTAVAELLAWIQSTAQLPSLPVTHGHVDVISTAYEQTCRLLQRWQTPVEPSVGLAAVLLQGAVTLADHVSSAHGHLHSAQPLDEGFRQALCGRLQADGRDLYPHQYEAAAAEGHVILRAPTGRGKTEAGLLWAITQIEAVTDASGGIPRFFYTLPYLASINAMADRLGGVIGDTMHIGVAHSRAGSYHLATAIESEDDESRQAVAARKAVSRAAATRLFQETIRVGTPYQLLRAALAGPAHSSVLIDSANSVFLLDELHAYEPRRLGYILAAMNLWERLGGRIGVLSATLPDVAIELISNSLTAPVKVIDGHSWQTLPRHRTALREQHLTDPLAVDEIAASLAEGRSVLVVANNVRDAQSLYDNLAPLAKELYGDNSAVLLHARFRRHDRHRIERVIRERYATHAERRSPGLVVGTQTLEVSLDLDCDVLYTSAAAMEALLQRFGRVNRIAARPPADVVIHLPRYAPRGNGGPEFADGVYPADAVRHTWQILARSEGSVIDEHTTIAWLNEIYDSPWGKQWRHDVEQARSRFNDEFLTFTEPFDDRSQLTESFDELFNGKEAILASDITTYAADLAKASGAAGRLLAEEHLIPLPHYARTRYNKDLGVHIIDAEYDPDTGLGALRTEEGDRYIAGEII